MALDLRTGDQSLTLDHADGVPTADGAALDVRRARLTTRGTAETVLLVLDGQPTVATVERDGRTTRVWIDGEPVEVETKTESDLLLERFGLEAEDASADREVTAPMPGLMLRVLVEPGQAVEAGQGVAVLEAMKMENELTAPAAGTIAAVHATAGDAVAKGDLLIEIDA